MASASASDFAPAAPIDTDRTRDLSGARKKLKQFMNSARGTSSVEGLAEAAPRSKETRSGDASGTDGEAEAESDGSIRILPLGNLGPTKGHATPEENRTEDATERTLKDGPETISPLENVIGPSSDVRVVELSSKPREILAEKSLGEPAQSTSQEPQIAGPPRSSLSLLSSFVSLVPSDTDAKPGQPQQRIARLESLVASLKGELEAARADRKKVVEATNFAVVRLVEELKQKEEEVRKQERARNEAREAEYRERIEELEGFIEDMGTEHGRLKRQLEGEIAQLKGRVGELQVMVAAISKPPPAPEPALPRAGSNQMSLEPSGRTGSDVLAESIATRAVDQLRTANARLRKDVEEAHGIVDKQHEKIETLIKEREDVERELVAERSRRTSIDSEFGMIFQQGPGGRRREDSVTNKLLFARSLVASPVTASSPGLLPVTRLPSNMSQSSTTQHGFAAEDDDPFRNLSNRYNLLQQQHHTLTKRLEEQSAANRELKRLIVQASLGPSATVPPTPTTTRRSGSILGLPFGGRKSVDVPETPTGDGLLLERYAEMQSELALLRSENEKLRVRVHELEWAVGEVVHEVDAAHQDALAESVPDEQTTPTTTLTASDPSLVTETVPLVELQPRKPSQIKRVTLDALKQKLGVVPEEEIVGDEPNDPTTATGVADSLLGKDLRTACSRCGASEYPVVML